MPEKPRRRKRCWWEIQPKPARVGNAKADVTGKIEVDVDEYTALCAEHDIIRQLISMIERASPFDQTVIDDLKQSHTAVLLRRRDLAA